jgi:hypothetical protein
MKKLTTVFLVLISLGFVACSNPSSSGSSTKSSGISVNAKWFVAKGAPVASSGANGDLYLDTDNTILYVKVGGSWTSAAQLKGSNGAGWTIGTGVPAASIGSDGDLYLDSASTIAYEKASGAWTALFTLKGDTGAAGAAGSNGTNGTNGVNGTNGTAWWTGSGTPISGSASGSVSGDLYLDTASAKVYRKAADGSWSMVVSFQAVLTSQFVFTPYLSNSRSVYGVAFANGTYVAVGSYGTIVTTTDGKNWTWRADGYSTPSGYLSGNSITLNASGASPAIHYTTDGSTPTGSSTLYSSPFVIGNGATVVKAIAIVGGITSPVYSQRFTYVLTSVSPAFSTVGHAALGTDKSPSGKRKAAVNSVSGPGSAKGPKGLLTSTSPTGVTPNDLKGVASDGNATFVAAGGAYYVIDSGNADHYYSIYRSTDSGSTWTPIEIPGQTGNAYGIVYGNGSFVAYYDAAVYSSPNGLTWTTVTIPASVHVQSVGYLNGTWTLFVQNGAGTLDIYSAGSLSTGWTGTPASLTMNYDVYGSVYGNGISVAVGYRGDSNSALILTRGDGDPSWTTQDIPPGTYSLYGIAYGAGGFIAVGSSGGILTSSNGKTWTKQYWGYDEFDGVAVGTIGNDPVSVVAVSGGC